MSDNNNGSEWKDKELGVLWKTESKTSGNKFLRGKITVNGEEIQVMVFPTKDKRNEKSPDFVIYVSGDRAPLGNGGGAPKPAYNRSRNTGNGNSSGGYQRRSYPPRNNNRGDGGGQPSQEFL